MFKAFCGFYASHNFIVLSWEPDAKNLSEVGSHVIASTEFSWANKYKSELVRHTFNFIGGHNFEHTKVTHILVFEQRDLRSGQVQSSSF